MNQSMEIAVKHGFRPGKDTHLLWSIKSRMRAIESEIRHHHKRRQEYKSQGKHTLAHDREVSIDKEVRAYNELKTLFRMLNSGPPFPKNFSKRAWIEEPYWYCCRCGFLDPGEVTHDGKCGKCGCSLPI